MKQYNKPRKSCALFGLGFMEMIPSPRLGFLRGVFLANHLASTDNLVRTTKRQNIHQRKLTIHKSFTGLRQFRLPTDSVKVLKWWGLPPNYLGKFQWNYVLTIKKW